MNSQESRPMLSQPKTGMTNNSFAVQKKKKKSQPKKVKSMRLTFHAPQPDLDLKRRILSTLTQYAKSRGFKEGRSPTAVELDRDIPFFKEYFYKGTQVPVLRLQFTAQVPTISSNKVQYTLDLNNTILIDWSSITALFSEFRYVRGEVHYTPFQAVSSAVTGQVEPALGAISYEAGATGAPSSYDLVETYDDKKRFVPVLVGSYGDSKMTSTKWKVEPDFAPGQEWLPISDTAYVPARFKMFCSVTGTDTTQLGHVTGFLDVQFRGLQ